jgi:pimeloyl-ACP methyl ester carboxylesterase
MSCSSPSAPSSTPGGDPGLAVSFRTPDGVTLTGRTFGSGRSGVVLAHMFPSDATSWYGAARTLAGDGYRALAFNFRGYEPSSGSRDPSRAAVDLRSAYDWLKAEGAERVSLVGASMGGTASLIVAAEVDAPAVVALSAPVTFRGLDAGAVAADVTEPVLLLASRDDPSGAADALRRLSGLLPDDQARLYAGEAHGTDLLKSRPESIDEIASFLREHEPAS